MEEKLREYRALRRRKQMIENAKQKLEETKEKIVNFVVPKIFSNMTKEKDDEVLLMEEEEIPEPTQVPVRAPVIVEEEESEENEPEDTVEGKEESWRYFITKWTLYTLIWVSAYMYCLTIDFGAVFFVISLLIGICLNTRTRKRKKGEVSAYSVFNENCASIDGTLKAEDLEKQMLYGIGGIRMF